MRLPKGFTLREGASLGGPLPRRVVIIQEYLDKVKFQEVITTFQLSQGVSCTQQYVQGIGSHPALAEYRFKTIGQPILWGSKRTIAELKKQLEKA